MEKYSEQYYEHMAGHKNPNNAKAMKKYMRDKFEYFGIKAPVLAALNRDFLKKHGPPERTDLKPVLYNLWKFDERECQYFGMRLMNKFSKKFILSDIDIIEYLIVNKSWWDTVDFVASNLAGSYLKKFPDRMQHINKKWINSDNMWLQRTAILFQLKYKETVDLNILYGNILQRCDHPDFFIRKAIGWALREYSKVNPEEVMRFVEEHEEKLSNLSKKEALKVINRK